jgi:hypothetical protein
MPTYKKQKPQVRLMALAKLLPRSPRNRAIAFLRFVAAGFNRMKMRRQVPRAIKCMGQQTAPRTLTGTGVATERF